MFQGDIRLGVFVCNCGKNIGEIVNVPQVVEFARTLEGVVLAEEEGWICSTSYQDTIRNSIREHSLNRVVVAACTPRTHAYLFQRTCQEAGLNKYLFEFANIREQCSWVHKEAKEAATEKAKDLLAMAVAKARLLQPLEDVALPVGRDSLVIGAGIAGMTAAITLADMGFNVTLIEREKELGGLLRKLHRLYPHDLSAAEVLQRSVKEVHKRPNIQVCPQTSIQEVAGYLGDWRVVLSRNGGSETLNVSTIIVATGLREADLNLGNGPQTLSQLQLEELLREGKLGRVHSAVMINCMDLGQDYAKCSSCRLGCGVSLKNAKLIRELYPDSQVYVISQDIVLPGREEDYFKAIIEDLSITIVRYSPEKKPRVSRQDGKLMVQVYDVLLHQDILIEADLVVFAAPLEGDTENGTLARMLKVPLGSGRFLQEAHIKLRPLEFMTDGIYLCGGAHSPKPVYEVIEQATGAAMKASIPMMRGVFTAEGINAEVKAEQCGGCRQCLAVCPFEAIRLQDGKALVLPALCRGCGSCAAACPQKALAVTHFSSEQVLAQIEQALAHNPQSKMLAFLCHWCSYAAADFAGVSRLQYSPAVRIIRLMCSGRVEPLYIYRALNLGAGKVLVAGCAPGECHYVSGNTHCSSRMEKLTQGLPIKAPCDKACLAGVNALGYISLIAQGRFRDALELVRQTMPFAGVCGRVCSAPCEAACERGKSDPPVAIRALKRFVADGDVGSWRKAEPTIKPGEARVAIVGSGPAGLACAYDLVREGYPVTVFEALPEPGGLLRYGIPEYRLPKAILDKEIGYIKALGVQIKTDTVVSRLDDLFQQGYRAVFLATGAQGNERLGVPGEEGPGVIQAVDLLRRINSGEAVSLGAKVAVIGGGNAAIDAARAAWRLGAREVTIIYRRSRAEMPAIPAEIEEAEREGIGIHFLTSPVRVLYQDGKLRAIECLRVQLAEPDATGRPRPVPVPGSEFTMEVDSIIVAIGRFVDRAALPAGLVSAEGGPLPVDPITLETEVKGVFAGGDVATGPGDVISAIAAGKEAAISILRYLKGVDLREGRVREAGPAEAGRPRPAPRVMSTLGLEARPGSFAEVELGLDAETAVQEARRCLHCAVCFQCQECIELSQVGILDDGRNIVTIDPQRLKVAWMTAAEGERFAQVVTQMAEELEPAL